MRVCLLASLVATGVRIAANHIQSRLVLSDSELVARTKDGDDEAFSEIVRRYQDFVHRQAWSYLLDNDAAEDVSQDVFVAAYKGIPYLRNDSALRGWLHRICRNHCLNVIRRRNLERKFHREASDEVTADVDLRVTVREMISGLNDEYR